MSGNFVRWAQILLKMVENTGNESPQFQNDKMRFAGVGRYKKCPPNKITILLASAQLFYNVLN